MQETVLSSNLQLKKLLTWVWNKFQVIPLQNDFIFCTLSACHARFHFNNPCYIFPKKVANFNNLSIISDADIYGKMSIHRFHFVLIALKKSHYNYWTNKKQNHPWHILNKYISKWNYDWNKVISFHINTISLQGTMKMLSHNSEYTTKLINYNYNEKPTY